MTKNRILVVDDEESVASFLRLSLIELAPEYGVETAHSAREALALMSRQPFDMLITDLRMPGIDGLELMRRVRERHPRTRMILITGYGDDRIEMQSYQIGACRYLNKPFQVEELLAAIRQALAPARAPGRDILVLSDTQFDAIAERLSGLLFELDAQCILLADVSGRVIAQVGETGSLDPSMLVSLIGGSFATSFELARYLQDNDAVTLNYHEGAHYDIYSSNVGTDFFLVLLFEKRTQSSRLGMVWLYVRRALGELQKLMRRASTVEGGKMLDADFGSLLSNSMDQAFGGQAGDMAAPLHRGAPQPPMPEKPVTPPRVTQPEPLRRESKPAPPSREIRSGTSSREPAPPRRAAEPKGHGQEKTGSPADSSGADEKPPQETQTFDLEQAIALGLLDASWIEDHENDAAATDGEAPTE
ncbi:MAG: response regulator [Anaerolineae bacterium]|nr:response regulator [Anaerolineae bacterium]